MHELSITRSVVGIVRERAAGRKVKRVTLTIGKLSGIEVEAVRFCFPMVSEGTELEGATLEIDEPEGRARCLGCQEMLTLTVPLGLCPCERRERLELVSGEELTVKEMEVD